MLNRPCVYISWICAKCRWKILIKRSEPCCYRYRNVVGPNCAWAHVYCWTLVFDVCVSEVWIECEWTECGWRAFFPIVAHRKPFDFFRQKFYCKILNLTDKRFIQIKQWYYCEILLCVCEIFWLIIKKHFYILVLISCCDPADKLC